MDTQNSPQSSNSDQGSLVGCVIVFLLPIAWLLYAMWFAPDIRREDQIFPEKCQIYPQTSAAFSTFEFRIVRMSSENIDIFISRKDFETVSYPDRKDVIAQIGRSWGAFADWYCFASVRIRDVATGKVFADYSCNLDRVSLHEMN